MTRSDPPSAAQRLRELRSLLPPPEGPLRVRESLRRLCGEIHLEGRIEESLQAAPAKAGPLNSQGVVVRALQRLQHLSPAYLASLMHQIDALAALEALRLGAKTSKPSSSPQARSSANASSSPAKRRRTRSG